MATQPATLQFGRAPDVLSGAFDVRVVSRMDEAKAEEVDRLNAALSQDPTLEHLRQGFLNCCQQTRTAVSLTRCLTI